MESPGSGDLQFRDIPPVDRILTSINHHGVPRPIVTHFVRQFLEEIRSNLKNVDQAARKAYPSDSSAIMSEVENRIAKLAQTRLRTVINGTGVILHTNQGRAPIHPDVMQHIAEIGTTYSTLEMDITTGKRGRRGAYAEQLLAGLCGAEAATIVNNCAAALVLILKQLCGKPEANEVLISRSELVQIGGGFRIPDILMTSGATLREVGTTNRTTIKDYQSAISPASAMILKVHQSNFYMDGFVENPTTQALAELAQTHKIPLVFDLGSGAVTDTSQWDGAAHEVTPAEVISNGADLVCFSGDKLFGGPQAGIIAGKNELVSALKKNQFFRCLRADKLVIAGLEWAASAWLTDPSKGHSASRAAGLCALTTQDLTARAEAIAQQFSSHRLKVSIVTTSSKMGGGTMPRAVLPSVGLSIQYPGLTPDGLTQKLLKATPLPVVAHIENDQVIIDLRTVFPDQDEALTEALMHTESS